MLVLGRFSKVFSKVGEILAFLTIIVLGLVYLNDFLLTRFSFNLLGDFYYTLVKIKDYAVIFTLIICGLAFASRRTLILFIPFCVLAIAALGLYSINLLQLF